MVEQKKAYDLSDDHLLIQSQKKIIADLSAQIKLIEKQCCQIINSDENLAQQYKWITSVKGIDSMACDCGNSWIYKIPNLDKVGLLLWNRPLSISEWNQYQGKNHDESSGR